MVSSSHGVRATLNADMKVGSVEETITVSAPLRRNIHNVVAASRADA